MSASSRTIAGTRRLTRERKGKVPVQAYIDEELYRAFRHKFRKRGAISRCIRGAFEAAVADVDVEAMAKAEAVRQELEEEENAGDV